MPTVSLDLARCARLFHALSDETRVAVLQLLGDGELCVCDLQAALDMAQSRLSFHLKVLKDAGLVRDRKDGRWSYYTLESDALTEAHDIVHALASPRAAGTAAVGTATVGTATARPSALGRVITAPGSCCG
jgi:ArsR family transcriptional regulator